MAPEVVTTIKVGNTALSFKAIFLNTSYSPKKKAEMSDRNNQSMQYNLECKSKINQME